MVSDVGKRDAGGRGGQQLRSAPARYIAVLAATHELFTFRHGLNACAWSCTVLGHWVVVFQAVTDCSRGGLETSRLQ